MDHTPLPASDESGDDEQPMCERPSCSADDHAQDPVEDKVEVKVEDEVDCAPLNGLGLLFIKIIKVAVYHLLNMTIHKYRTKKCSGCRTNHPSQRHHECLEILPDNFYEDNYYRLMEELVTPRFIPSIQCLVKAYNIETDHDKVRAVALTLLHELQWREKFSDAITDMYENQVGEDMVRIDQLRLVSDCFNGFE